MSSTVLILVIVALAAIAVAAWALWQKQRTQKLRGQFGPEYDRMVQQTGNQRRAEDELVKREERVRKFNIHPLAPEARDRYAAAWRNDQARFVDDPGMAVREADRLITEVMRERGYPMAEFDQLAADLSVDHPHVVENYRAAHALALRQQSGQASTEELRQAMVYYRKLFEELVGTHVMEPVR